MIKPLNRVDVTHRNFTDPGVVWLFANGYRPKCDGRRVYLEREVPRLRLIKGLRAK